MDNKDYEKEAKDTLSIFLILIAGAVALVYFVPETYQLPWFITKKAEIYLIIGLSYVDLKNVIVSREMLENALFINQKLNEIPIGEFYWEGMNNTDKATHFFGYVFNVILFGLGAKLAFTNNEKFKTRHDLESLLKFTSVKWRTQRYLIKHNPLEVSGYDATKSNFRVRDKPIEYLKRNGVLIFDGDNYAFNRVALQEVYQKQLGPENNGIDGLKDFEKVLFAAFSLVLCCIDQKTNKTSGVKASKIEAENLLGDLSFYYNDEYSIKDVLSKAKKINNYAVKQEKIQKILANHAHNTTLLRSMLSQVRKQSGVFAAALFGCIALEDRVQFVSLFDEGAPESAVETYAIELNLHYEQQTGRRCLMMHTARMEKYIDIYLARAQYNKKKSLSTKTDNDTGQINQSQKVL
ncbi:hypothetical protein GCM10011607_28340 [Shewanella inventionis]|uniref:DotM C-terminal cytoplasmic domain-containing protein n=1 Tax=Shewanella inventionis TaxID=1738770 RepID=A0ABQ1JH90_9GAMM|nr:hypothetical protein [Shewanella inventionis]GGB65973.1 hypothetical protein GCM10011607_28340 [Shewanella inventionis]